MDLHGTHAFLCLCRTLTETRLPVASGRLLSASLRIITLLTPFISWVCVPSVIPATILSCTLIFISTALAELSSDLEDPFVFHTGTEVSTGALPLSVLQFKLNERLLAVSTTYRPHGNADVSDHTGAVATAAATLSARARLHLTPQWLQGASTRAQAELQIRTQVHHQFAVGLTVGLQHAPAAPSTVPP